MRSFEIDRRVAPQALSARGRALVGVALLAASCQTAFPYASASGETSKKPKPPSASTGSSLASGSEVELRGTVNPRGEAATYYFQYGPTSAYGAQTLSASLPAGSVAVKVSQTVANLASGDHYRLVATNGSGTGDGLDRTYTAKSIKITKTNKTTKPLGLKFTLTSPPAEGQPVGSPVTVEGTLSGPAAAGQALVLQSSPYPSGAVFTNVGSPQTGSANGRFSFFMAHLARSTRFRVVAVGPQPTYSPVIVELATVHVTLHVRSARHAGLVRLYGTVSPAVKDAIVYFQLQEAARPPKITIPKSEKAEEKAEERAEIPRYAIEFSSPIKHATRTLSRFSLVTDIRKEGFYRAYVQVPRGPLASGFSKSVLLRATAKKRSGPKG
jgi:hypothetical protein